MKLFHSHSILFLVSLLFAGLQLTSCENSEYSPELVPGLTPTYLTASKNSFSVTAEKQDVQTDVQASGVSWSFADVASWIKASPNSGSGDAEVTFSVAENLSGDTSRVAVFNLQSAGSEFNFRTAMTMSQQAASPTLNCDPTLLGFNASGGDATVSVISNVKWTATCTSDWVKLTVKDQNIAIKASPNTDQLSRSATISINGGGLARTVSVVQKGAIATVEETIETEASGETKKVLIQVADKWEAKTSSSWITVSPTAGEAGDHLLDITTLQNTDISAREDFVYVVIDQQNAYEIKVTQKGLNLDCTPTSMFFYKAGGTESLAITANGPWKIESKPAWITTKEEDGTLQVTAKVNDTGQNRTGKVVLCSTLNTTLKATVNIEQSKYLEDELVDPNKLTISLPHEGGSASLDVLARNAWTSEAKQTWLSRTPESGTGPATMTITAQENNDTISRQGELIVKSSVKSNNYSNSVIVEQASKIFRVTADALNDIPSKGQTVSVAIQANEGWDVTSKPSWVTATPTSGSGTDILKLKIGDNASASGRDGRVEVKSKKSKSEFYFDIHQNARYLNVSTSKLQFLAAGGDRTFVVETDGEVALSNTPDWITITSEGSVYTVTCAENKKTEGRNSEVTLSLKNLTSGSIEHTISIEQYGKNDYHLWVEPSSITVPYNSCKEKITITSNDSWKIVSKPSWITASVSVANGDKESELTISENNSGNPRSGLVIVEGDNCGKRDTAEVYQNARTLSVSDDNLVFSSSESQKKVTVTADGSFKATSNNTSWLSVTTSGSELTIKVTEYHSTAHRDGTIKVELTGLASGSVEKIINVRQDGVTGGITVTPSEVNVTYSATEKDVTVSTQESWTATKNASWISLNATSGTGNKSVRLSIGENNTPNERTGLAIFKATSSNTKDTVVVTQTGRNISCDYQSLSFGKDGGTKELTVIADGSYSASTSDSWLTVTRSGNKVTVKASAASTANIRNGKVTLKLENLSSGSKSIDVSVTQEGVPTGITASPTPIDVTYSAVSKTVTVTTEESWTATKNADWITLSVSSGTGSKTLTVNVSENNTPNDRAGKINFKTASGSEAEVTVNQSGRNITCSTASLSFGKEGGTQKFNVTADGNYSATSSDNWLSVSKNGNEVTVTATAATATEPRNGKVTLALTGLSSGSKSVQVNVSQNGVDGGISASPSPIDITCAATSKDVSVSTEESWTASKDADWITLSASSGTGSKTVTLNMTQNTGKTTRTGKVTFTTASNKTATVVVNQKGMGIAADPTSVIVYWEEQSKNVSITTEESWTASKDASWITLSASSGTGNKTVTFTMAANNTTEIRYGTVTFKTASGAKEVVNVKQWGRDISEVNPENLSFAREGGSKTVNVTADGSFSATPDVSWLTASVNGGVVTVTATANSSASRSGIITLALTGLASGSYTKTIQVTQDGIGSISADPTSINIYWEEQSKNVSITTTESWTAQKDVSWITLSASSGSGNKTVKFTMAANNTTEIRYGTVTFKTASGAKEVVNVKQWGRDISEVSPENLSFPKEGGTNTVNVTADGSYSATPNVSWLTASVSGGEVTVTANANSQTSQREGKITLALTGLTSGSYTKTITVSQDAGSSGDSDSDISIGGYEDDTNLDNR